MVGFKRPLPKATGRGCLCPSARKSAKGLTLYDVTIIESGNRFGQRENNIPEDFLGEKP